MNNAKEIAFIKVVIETLNSRKIDYFLIGAAARNLLFESCGLQGLRKTNDWDFAVQVKSWDDYEKLMNALKHRGFTEGKSSHTLTRDGLIIDIVPFGESIEDDKSHIIFPEPSGNKMNMTGFDDFLKHTKEIEYFSLKIKIGAFAALLGSKIFAWEDRKYVDDARDIFELTQSYESVSGKSYYDEIGEADFPFADDHNDDIAMAYLSGRSVARALSSESQNRTILLLESWLTSPYPEVTKPWNFLSYSLDQDAHDEFKKRYLEAFLLGLKNRTK